MRNGFGAATRVHPHPETIKREPGDPARGRRIDAEGLIRYPCDGLRALREHEGDLRVAAHLRAGRRVRADDLALRHGLVVLARRRADDEVVASVADFEVQARLAGLAGGGNA